MKKKILRFVELIIVFGLILLNTYVFVKIWDINHELSYLQDKETSLERNVVIKSDLDDLRKRIGKLESTTDEITRRITEETFFSNNERRYELENGRFVLGFCCINGNNQLVYDFLIEDPPGSGELDDFGTTSYINFYSADVIKSFRVIPVGNLLDRKIYKIIIDSNTRHSEGVIYPQDEGFAIFYEYLYRINKDMRNYTADISFTNDGYVVTVNSYDNKVGEYILTVDGEGYVVEVIKDVNAKTENGQ